MAKFLIWLINLYQKIPLRAHYSCVFIPTCSEYTKQSIEKHGAFKGLFKGLKRITRCHPWQKKHYDPVE